MRCEMFGTVFEGDRRSTDEMPVFIVKAEVHFDPGGERMGFEVFGGAVGFGG